MRFKTQMSDNHRIDVSYDDSSFIYTESLENIHVVYLSPKKRVKQHLMNVLNPEHLVMQLKIICKFDLLPCWLA